MQPCFTMLHIVQRLTNFKIFFCWNIHTNPHVHFFLFPKCNLVMFGYLQLSVSYLFLNDFTFYYCKRELGRKCFLFYCASMPEGCITTNIFTYIKIFYHTFIFFRINLHTPTINIFFPTRLSENKSDIMVAQ